MGMTRLLRRWLSSALDVGGLDTTEYVEHVEREFGIVIRDEAVNGLTTLRDLCAYISRRRQEQGRPLPEEVVWQTVRRITSEEFGVDASELHPGIRYVENLNC